MSSYRKAVSRHTPSSWAQMKLRNGYTLTREDKILLGMPIGTVQVPSLTDDNKTLLLDMHGKKVFDPAAPSGAKEE